MQMTIVWVHVLHAKINGRETDRRWWSQMWTQFSDGSDRAIRPWMCQGHLYCACITESTFSAAFTITTCIFALVSCIEIGPLSFSVISHPVKACWLAGDTPNQWSHPGTEWTKLYTQGTKANIQVVMIKAKENIHNDRLRRVSLHEKTCHKPCQAYRWSGHGCAKASCIVHM